MLVDSSLEMSREEYLRLERQADYKSEYHKGQVFAMAGASRNHNRIVTNVSTSLDIQLKSRNCNNYSNDMRVSIQKEERYLYPDIVVTCGEEEFEDNNKDILLNPVIIIEILSPTTEAYDRGSKFLYYQTIDSLREYVLISQYPKRLEIYRKQMDGAWLYRPLNQMPAKLDLESIDCILASEDIYSKVDMEST